MKAQAPAVTPVKAAAPSPTRASAPPEREAPFPTEEAPGPTLERAGRLGHNPASIAAGLAHSRTLQRLVGFEVELNVPTMGPPQPIADPPFDKSRGGKPPAPQIDQFLNRGLDYGHVDRGTDPVFRLTVDHDRNFIPAWKSLWGGLKAIGCLAKESEPDPLISNTTGYGPAPSGSVSVPASVMPPGPG